MKMFDIIEARCELTENALQRLLHDGFAIIPRVVQPERVPQLSEAYELAVATAPSCDLSIGRTTTRVSNLIDRGPEFSQLHLYPPVLEACSRIIRQPFKLSTLHARTLHAHAPAQDLHVDFKADVDGWPMVGFILMVDEFRSDNGATRFVPGSHEWSNHGGKHTHAGVATEGHPYLSACGPAGSLIIYNGSVWHRHGANRTGQPRRSIQGAYIRCDAINLNL